MTINISIYRFLNSLTSRVKATSAALVAAAAAIAVMASSCADDIGYRDYAVVEGLAATVTIPVKLTDREALSRADVPDYRITSLWVGIFNASTSELKGSVVKENLTDDSANAKWEEIEIATTSGKCHVVAIANFESRYALRDDGSVITMRQAISEIKTWDDYDNLAAVFTPDGEISIDEPLNALLMSGTYSEEYSEDQETTHPGVTAPASTLLTIAPGNFRAPGAIHLRRLISHNTFNVAFNPDNVESFKLTSWQVHNVPNSCWMRERGDQENFINSGEAKKINGLAVENSNINTVAVTSGNKLTFDFWQLENRHTGLAPSSSYTAADVYHYRDREFKAADGTNTGVFSSLVATADSDAYAQNATFVTFTVEMTMKVDSEGNKLTDKNIAQRNVEATYTVHLGYCENRDDPFARARDFNCRRNSRYTYNVTVNNVADLHLETKRDGAERVPSIEGNITDIADRYVQLDCHYNVLNVYFSREDLEDFKYYLHAYDQNGQRIVFSSESGVPREGDDDFRYFSWVEFRPTTSESVLSAYKPRSGTYADGKTYLLSDMKGKPGGYYTLFINEYAYEETGADGAIAEKDRYNWRWFVNQPDRRVWLNVLGEVSADKESIYHSSKYAISQRSIQTYYDRDQDISALGVEHLNESLGLNMRNNYNTAGASYPDGIGYKSSSGRYIVAQYIMGRAASSSTGGNWRDNYYNWTKVIDQTRPQTVNECSNTPQNFYQAAKTLTLPAYNDVSSFSGKTSYDPDQTSRPKYVNMISACMNRNRDLDGDGKIDRGEVRWFVPSDVQNIRMILGRQALTTPVMDYESINYQLSSANGDNSRLLMACANGKTLWAMEGLSLSWWKQWSNEPWQVRCVRYLGSDFNDFTPDTHAALPYYRSDESTDIIEMGRIDSRAIRQEPYTDSRYVMPPHVLNDQRYNRCYKAFEVSTEVIVLNAANTGLSSNMLWSDYLRAHNPCAKLDTATKKGWRVPNQKEAAIYSTFNASDGTPYHSAEGTGVTYLMTSTFTYFDRQGNTYDGGVISEADLLSLKIVTATGNGTQGGGVVYVPNTIFGVRCVRDVVR